MFYITLAVNSTPVNKSYITYLDMSKAFDKLDHTKSLGRLQQYGISSKIHDWFRSYLQGSKQQFTVLGATSQKLPVTSGVPQGSLVGAILFLLFVDDLPNTFKTSRVACYADDTKIFKSIDSITNCNALQSDLNDLVSWSESSGFISNQSKCKYQCISRKKSPVQSIHNINKTPLESCDTEKSPWCVSVKQSYLGEAKTEQCALSTHPKHPNASYTLSFYRPVPCGYATQVWWPQSIGLLSKTS